MIYFLPSLLLAITPRTATHDLGLTRKGAILHHAFEVRNDRSSSMHLIRTQASCACVAAALPEGGKVLAPGAKMAPDRPIMTDKPGSIEPGLLTFLPPDPSE